MGRKSGSSGSGSTNSNLKRRRDVKKSRGEPQQKSQPSEEQRCQVDKRERDIKNTVALEEYLPPNEWFGCRILFATIIAAYAPSLSGAFIWDDIIFARSPQVTTWRGVLDLWFNPGQVDKEVHFWPVTYTSFWIEHKLWGLEPLGYRLTNLALHFANACLVWRLLVRRLGLSDAAGWISAFLFALHPVRVESVAWIIERKDTLSGLFYLGALLLHPNLYPDGCRYGPQDGAARRKACLASLVLYILGMLTKTIVVSLPVILLLIPWMLRGKIRRREVMDAAPYFAVGVALALFDMSLDDKSTIGFGYTPFERILIASRAVCFYIQKLIWPVDLIMIYPLWDLRQDPWVWFSCALAVPAALIGLWTARHRLGRGPIAALIFFGATLGPTLCLIDYSWMQFSFVADRFQYLAGIGPVAVFSSAYVAAFRRADTRTRHAAAMAMGLLFFILAVLTNKQCHHYKDDEFFFRHVVERNPGGYAGWSQLGIAFEGRNLTKSALCHKKATELLQEDIAPHIRQLQGSTCHGNYGSALIDLGRYEEAIIQLERALEFNRRYNKVLGALGTAYALTGRNEEAVRYLRLFVEVEPADSGAWGNLGAILAQLGRFDEAIEPMGRAAALEPSNIDLRVNLGKVLGRLGRHEDAVEHYRWVLQQHPGHREAKKLLDFLLQ